MTLAAAGHAAVVVTEAQAAPRSVRDGIYTVAQADEGRQTYTDKCASCHGAMTSATPDMAPLLNDYVFQDTWKMRSVGDLFDRIRTTMPQNEPGTLTPERTAGIVAYILSVNQAPPGTAPLAADVETLKAIRMDLSQP